MTKVYFVRHAQTDYSNPIDRDRVLTKKGMQDRYKARDYLISQGVDKEILHIYSSSYRRAIDTIQPFADYVGLSIQPLEEFREWSVIAPEKEYYAACKKAWKDYTYRLDGCETLEEVQQRNVQKLLELIQMHQDETIVIGSHGTALSTILHYFNSNYNYEDLMRIMEIKPWIVRFEFEKEKFLAYDEVFPIPTNENNFYPIHAN